MSFQPISDHLDLSKINENRPSLPRNNIMAFQNTQDKEKNLREKITKNQSPTKDWKSEGLSFSPSTLEARRQGARPSLF